MSTSTSAPRIPFAIATVFGAGLSPVAPGTVGSLVALPLAWALLSVSITQALIAILVLFLVGLWASDAVERSLGRHDASLIVIDEVVGQCLVVVLLGQWLFVVIDDSALLIVGFMAFRAFDIVKPWPVSWADRSVSGGLGVMLDDVIAGLFATLVAGATCLIYVLASA